MKRNKILKLLKSKGIDLPKNHLSYHCIPEVYNKIRSIFFLYNIVFKVKKDDTLMYVKRSFNMLFYKIGRYQ